jgi:hypothetical protein
VATSSGSSVGVKVGVGVSVGVDVGVGLEVDVDLDVEVDVDVVVELRDGVPEVCKDDIADEFPDVCDAVGTRAELALELPSTAVEE